MTDIEREQDASAAAPSTDAAPARRKPLTAEAQRALAEAAERRAQAERTPSLDKPKEFQGPRGLEPTRFGDWERKGIASDF